MKILFSLLVILNLFLLLYLPALADECITGFACSISELEKNEKIKQQLFIKNIDKYFSKDINDITFGGYLSSNVNYNDLFIFNTIV